MLYDGLNNIIPLTTLSECSEIIQKLAILMNTFALEAELREALSHLHDPDYTPSRALALLLGCTPTEDTLKIQSALLRAIQELAPSAAATPASPPRRIHDLLHHRFVLKLTLQETAERMNLSLSSTCRTQRAAIHALARFLWERHQLASSAPNHESIQPGIGEQPQINGWREQTRRELAALAASSPGVISNVGKVIQGVCELLTPILSKSGVAVEIGAVQPGLTAAIHPSVLRQLLITSIRRMAESGAKTPLTIRARMQGGDVRISITGRFRPDQTFTPEVLTDDLLATDEVIVETEVQDSEVQLILEVASIGAATVLLVDDNLDLARLYSRAFEGTRYRLIHTAQGEGLFDVVRAVVPDVIILDVMLPDLDGWDLLMRLRADVSTRTLPIVVSTVVKEEELAISLGATYFLPKPVRPRDLIQALNQLLPQT